MGEQNGAKVTPWRGPFWSKRSSKFVFALLKVQ